MNPALTKVAIWRWAAVLVVLVSSLIPIVHALEHHDPGAGCTYCLSLHGLSAILVPARLAMAAPAVTAHKAAPQPPSGTLHHNNTSPERGPPAVS